MGRFIAYNYTLSKRSYNEKKLECYIPYLQQAMKWEIYNSNHNLNEEHTNAEEININGKMVLCTTQTFIRQ